MSALGSRRDRHPVLDPSGDGRPHSRSAVERTHHVGRRSSRRERRPGVATHAEQRTCRLPALLGAGQRDGEGELRDRHRDDEQWQRANTRLTHPGGDEEGDTTRGPASGVEEQAGKSGHRGHHEQGTGDAPPDRSTGRRQIAASHHAALAQGDEGERGGGDHRGHGRGAAQLPATGRDPSGVAVRRRTARVGCTRRENRAPGTRGTRSEERAPRPTTTTRRDRARARRRGRRRRPRPAPTRRPRRRARRRSRPGSLHARG